MLLYKQLIEIVVYPSYSSFITMITIIRWTILWNNTYNVASWREIKTTYDYDVISL